MSAPTERQGLPDTLIEVLDDLDAPTLRRVRTYVEQRLDDLQPSLEAQIRSEANGEVVDIQDCGAYTLVRKYPPAQDNPEKATGPLTLYRVKPETQPNEQTSLHWSYLGDITEQSGIECSNCGNVVNTHEIACPNCGETTAHDTKEV